MGTDWKAVIATLAHEICHHVIYQCGIRPHNMDWMVETYTDLCTIYVGFGKIILEGYKTNVGGTKRTLGYLDWNTYMVTNHLVGVVCGDNHSDKTGLKGSDFLADDAIDIWEKTEDRASSLKEIFRKQSEPIADMQRGLRYLEQIIGYYREEIRNRVDELSKLFFVDVESNTNKPLALFRCIYESTIHTEVSSFEKKLAEHNDTIEEAIFLTYSELNKYRRTLFDNSFVCPSCGRSYKGKSENQGIVIIKCGQCGTRFALNTEEWNATKLQRKFEKKLRERNSDYLEKFKRDESDKLHKELSNTRTKLSIESGRLKNESGRLQEKEKQLTSLGNYLLQSRVDAINIYLNNLPPFLHRIVRKIADSRILSRMGETERNTKKALNRFEKKQGNRKLWEAALKSLCDNLDDLQGLIDNSNSIDKSTIKRLSDFANILIESDSKQLRLQMAVLELENSSDNQSTLRKAVELLKIINGKLVLINPYANKYINKCLEIYKKKGHSQQEVETYKKSLVDDVIKYCNQYSD